MPVPGPRRGGSLPSTSVLPVRSRPALAWRRTPKKRQGMNGEASVNHYGGFCESHQHVVFTFQFWHETVDSHRKCASESRELCPVSSWWISSRRTCFFKAIFRFSAACRPPDSSRTSRIIRHYFYIGSLLLALYDLGDCDRPPSGPHVMGPDQDGRTSSTRSSIRVSSALADNRPGSVGRRSGTEPPAGKRISPHPIKHLDISTAGVAPCITTLHGRCLFGCSYAYE